MEDVQKITVWVETDKVGSRCEAEVEIEKELWDEMSEDERIEELQQEIWNMCEWGYEEE